MCCRFEHNFPTYLKAVLAAWNAKTESCSFGEVIEAPQANHRFTFGLAA